MSTITKPKVHVGARLMWDGNYENLTVIAVFDKPRASFAGNPLPPYASVQWEDGERDYINLADLQSRAYVPVR